MSDKRIRYWVIPDELWERYEADVQEARNQAADLRDEIGARALYVSEPDGRLMGFTFSDDPGDCWGMTDHAVTESNGKRLKIWRPRRNRKRGREISEKMQAVPPLHSAHKLGEWFLGRMGVISGMRMLSAGYEQIGETRILMAEAFWDQSVKGMMRCIDGEAREQAGKGVGEHGK